IATQIKPKRRKPQSNNEFYIDTNDKDSITPTTTTKAQLYTTLRRKSG
ncbi:8025_t:CDS:1, partial [Gigaspora rosea]